MSNDDAKKEVRPRGKYPPFSGGVKSEDEADIKELGRGLQKAFQPKTPPTPAKKPGIKYQPPRPPFGM